MAVYKTKTGKWQAVVSYRDDSGTARKKKKTFELKRDAQKYEFNFCAEEENKLIEKNKLNGLTYSDVFYQYIEYNKMTANERTIKSKINMANSMWPELFDRPFNSITKQDFFEVWMNIRKAGYSVHRENAYVQLLKSVSNFAYNFLDFDNNTKQIETQRIGYSKRRKPTIYTEEEFKILYDHVEDTTLKYLYWLLFYTGLRVGEARALLKSDLSNSTINVNKSMRAIKQGFNPTKNESSIREVQIDSITNEKMLELKSTDGDFLFGGLEPLSLRIVQDTFEDAIKSSGLHKIRIHDLRHSHATMLINRGVNILAVAQRLGHASPQTTLDTYAHLLKETSDEVIDVIENHD